MATVRFCGLKPLLHRRKSFASEWMKSCTTPKKTPKEHNEGKGESMEWSFVSSDQLILMMEIHNKILVFRDIMDLSPLNSSASLRQMVITTLEDLQRLYPGIIPRNKVSKIKDKSTDQGLAFFCEALKSVGESWMVNNDCVQNKKYYEFPSCKDNSNMRQLGETMLATLDCLMKIASDRFDVMEEDEQRRELSSPYRPFFCGSSPATPKSVLPEPMKYTAKGGDSPRSSCSSPLWSLRIQALGKLNPIDLKRLSFHMSPTHREAKKNRIEMDHGKDTSEGMIFDLDTTNGDHRETDEPQAMEEEEEPLPTPTPPPPPPLPLITPSMNMINTVPPPPRIPTENVSCTAIPPPPPPPMASSSAVPPPPPPPLASSLAVPAPPLPPFASSSAVPAPPLPPFASSSAVPAPPLPPFASSSAVPAPPPPPLASSSAVPATPPPMPHRNGGAAPPPPPPGVGRSLRPKATTKLKRSTQLGNLYRSLLGKVEGSSLKGKSSGGRGIATGAASAGGKQGMADALAEMTKRSSYFQQIEDDVQKYTKRIIELKSAINNFKTSDMTELVKFHKDVESVLENLTDESQVLSRFEGFPSKKLEAIRMAAALYNKLDSILTELQNWNITVTPVVQLLDKAERYFNKIKTELDALERTKDEESKKFKGHNIEFDFNILTKIKEAMVDVSSNCMELALKERRNDAAKRDSASNTDGGKRKEGGKLLWRAFQFAYRVYSFAGGIDDRADKLTKELAKEIESEPNNP